MLLAFFYCEEIEVMNKKQDINAIGKLFQLLKCIKNWYMVPIDKLGLTKMTEYYTRSGYHISCRSKSTDINEVVAIMSGLEYPGQYLTLEDGDIAIDAGANIGDFSFYVDFINRGKRYYCHAIEPYGPNMDMLVKNITQNSLQNKITPHKLALGGKDECVYLDTSRNFDSVSITDDPTGEKVQARTLESFCKLNQINHIRLLKLDIEGAEYELIEREWRYIAEKVDTLMIEYHNVDNIHNKASIVQILDKNFEIHTIYDAEGCGVVYCSRLK